MIDAFEEQPERRWRYFSDQVMGGYHKAKQISLKPMPALARIYRVGSRRRIMVDSSKYAARSTAPITLMHKA